MTGRRYNDQETAGTSRHLGQPPEGAETGSA